VKRPVAEQVVVVSGASSGIGRAVARLAGARGARVVVSARNAEALEHAVGEIEAAGGEGLAFPGEATSELDAESLCARAVERFGRIDTFVASVMVTVYAEVEQLEPEELRRVLDVNFLGRAYAYRAALPHLKASRGTFIDVNSGLAYRGIPLQAAYCASKAALDAMSRVMANELGPRGIRVNAVNPGPVDTGWMDDELRDRLIARQPTGRLGTPEDVARLVAFLLSDDGAWTTGQLIKTDGGFSS
jgi:3-oxoacyl-[acyl-carrier protein] reductase